jgi:uncharacterized membrane protein YuzA (DUF378 family)
MEGIVASFHNLIQAITAWEIVGILALFVLCAILGLTRHFFVLVGLCAFAWVIRDLSAKASSDPSNSALFTAVVLLGVLYILYAVYHHLVRSDH